MTTRRELERFVASRTGIDFSRGGVGRSLERFLEQRLGELRTPSLADYLSLLDKPDSPELERLVDAITVVHSWFFRDPGQLAALETLLSRASASGAPIQVWIAGCACGEEAYSIALIAERVGRPVQILGTDLNTRALAQAALGEYGRWSVRDVPPALRRFFQPVENRFRVDERMRQHVRFERRNLLAPPPTPLGGNGWDIIVCRNVLIYFERDKARQVFERQAAALASGGHLFLGASEVVFDVPRELEPVYAADRLVFRRAAQQSTPAAAAKAPPKPLIPRHGSRGCVSPLPALPASAAALVAEPRDRPSATRIKVDEDGALASGHALLDAGDHQAARDAYLRVVAEDATFAQGHMYAGIAQYLCGDIDRSLHHLRAALFLDGALWPAAFYLALCFESMAMPAEAYREYEHVIRLCERESTQPAQWHPSLSDWQRDLLELSRQRIAGRKAPASSRRAEPRKR